MKANYTKPLLAVEVFSLAQSTARDCADNIPKEQFNFNDPGTCAWDLGGITIFVDPPTCDINGEQMGYGCYNNPSDGQYIFRS